eukprot:4803146-Amphidinium_carterae.1
MAAMELLKSAAPDKELLLDELFSLTLLVGKPPLSRGCPHATLLDVAVQHLQHAAIPLLQQRGYCMEFLDAYSVEGMVMKDVESQTKVVLKEASI